MSAAAPPVMALDELLALTAERELHTVELLRSNAYYGHAHTLKQYAGLPADYPLKAIIEHGVTLNDFIWETEMQSLLPVFLTATPAYAELVRRASGGRKQAVAIGPMIQYVPLPEEEPAVRRLVAFPTHSTAHIDTNFDVDEFAARLEKLRPDFDEVVVCVYWRDAQRGLAAEYAARGFACTTAGHIYDPLFMTRLAGILHGAALVYTNQIGSHVIYAAALGRPLWLVPQEIELRSENDFNRHYIENERPRVFENPTVRRLYELFGERHDSLTPEQHSFVRQAGGLDCKKTPAELRDILHRAERLYRPAHALWQLRRFFHRAGRKLRGVAGS